MVNIGVIGCGHWGPNHIRVFNQLADSQVQMCADLNQERLNVIKTLYSECEITTKYRDIIQNESIDAVCVSSPTNTHFQFSKEALEHGKHVFCEKPLTLQPQESLELSRIVKDKEKILMVGHVFLFNSGIVWLKKCIDSGELGKILYAHSERTNLGPFRYDVNALWDLAPHDISIFNYLFEQGPISVSARGHKCLSENNEDLAFASLEYPNNIFVNVHVSWLDPKKVRQITIVGDKKMVVWDDLDNDGPIKLYDRHVERTSKFYETYGEFQLLSRLGSITVPNVGFQEPLKVQGQYFVDCVKNNTSPDITDAQKGYDVVNALCAIQKSIDNNGALEYIKS
ncbi:MAG: Gfo/Idh/MocA family oxidoreductase [Candidatus Omnitrophica bacterium]|nr:Gfo/Idh/MocA family oxidoreductase [Candidatus Omnitrophota bacterium]